MSIDLKKFIEDQRSILLAEKERLCVSENSINKNQICDINEYQNNNAQQSSNIEDKENVDTLNRSSSSCTSPRKSNVQSNQVELKVYEADVEKSKQAFIDKLSNAESPYLFRSDDATKCTMLRYGEYSPNNPELRVTGAAPYIGLGEYEQRRDYFLRKQKADYLRHLAENNKGIRNLSKRLFSESRDKLSNITNSKEVQTEIQNIHSKLVQYDLHSTSSPEKELSPLAVNNYLMQNNSSLGHYNRIDQRLTSAQNALLKPEMDKPKSILSNRRTGSPRERLMCDLKHSYTPSFMDGFSYQDRADELERERLKRETYQHELRMQIEEKRQMQAMREDQERREQELENKRLEQQLLRMQEEKMIEEQRRSRRDEQMRRHSEDLLSRKHELQSRHSFRKQIDTPNSVTANFRNTDVASKAYSHYSPPVSRRNPYSFNIPSTSVFADSASRFNPNRYDSYHHHQHPHTSRYDSLNRKDSLNRMDSLNTYDNQSYSNSRGNAAFGRFDSLSRIDSLNHRMESFNLRDSISSLSNGQRRHSATQQDLSVFRKSPKLQRRSSSSRFEMDTLPIPVLKAHSPVARELKNSIPFNSSRHSSDAVRKLEDKWQIPAVQKNIVNHNDGQNRSMLTQLGAIRMQLQQEQLRMDETLRRRGITQSKAVDFH